MLLNVFPEFIESTPKDIMRALEKEYARQRMAAYPAAKRVKAEQKAQSDLKKAVGHFAKWKAGQEVKRLQKEKALMSAYKKAFKAKSPATAARNMDIRRVARVRAGLRKRRNQQKTIPTTPMFHNNNSNANARARLNRKNANYRSSVFGKGALYN